MLVALIYSEWNDVESMVDEEPEVVGQREGTRVAVYYFGSSEERYEFTSKLSDLGTTFKMRWSEKNDAEGFMLDVLAEVA